MQIVGVGFNPVDSLQSWADDEGFEYDLWFDEDRTLAMYYGAATSSSWVPDRVTVLLDGDGNQLLEYDVGFGFGTHPSEVLADCEAIFGD